MTSPLQNKISKIIFVSFCVNVFLSILKISVGSIGHSSALFADGVHSLSDVVIDTLLFFGMSLSKRAPDRLRPYGWGRIETFLSLLLSLSVFSVGLYIFVGGLKHPASQNLPDPYTLWVATASIILNEGLYRMMMFFSKQEHSRLLKANAWHNRLDAWTSSLTWVGVFATRWGYPWADRLMAVGMGAWIVASALPLAWKSMAELLDFSSDLEVYQQVHEAILEVPGVVAAHQLRMRRIGEKLFADVHILVPERCSVSEGHYLGECVEHYLRHHFEALEDVVVHVDAEDDEQEMMEHSLPHRHFIVEVFNELLGEGRALNNEALTIHYLDNQIELDYHVALDDPLLFDTEDLITRLRLVFPLRALRIWSEFPSKGCHKTPGNF